MRGWCRALSPDGARRVSRGVRVLLDVGISPRLRSDLADALDGAVVESATFRGWRTLRNGELLRLAKQHGFTTLVTADKRLAQQQAPLPLAVVAVDDNRLSALRAAIHRIASAILETPAGADQLVVTRSDGDGPY